MSVGSLTIGPNARRATANNSKIVVDCITTVSTFTIDLQRKLTERSGIAPFIRIMSRDAVQELRTEGMPKINEIGGGDSAPLKQGTIANEEPFALDAGKSYT